MYLLLYVLAGAGVTGALPNSFSKSQDSATSSSIATAPSSGSLVLSVSSATSWPSGTSALSLGNEASSTWIARTSERPSGNGASYSLGSAQPSSDAQRSTPINSAAGSINGITYNNGFDSSSGGSGSTGRGSKFGSATGGSSGKANGGSTYTTGDDQVHDGEKQRLLPIVHWSIDTKPAENVIPNQVGSSSPHYYASDANVDANTQHLFGLITYQFITPFVNLDYAAQVQSVSYIRGQLVVAFASTQAYSYAMQYWLSNLILGAQSFDCGGDVGTGCYFKVNVCDFAANMLTATCSGSGRAINDITSRTDAEWGIYEPNRGSSFMSPPAQGAAQSYNSKPSPYFPGSPTKLGNSANPTSNNVLPSASGAINTQSKFDAPNATCVAPADQRYGLPTACTGDKFDFDLDQNLGEVTDNNGGQFAAFINDVAPGADKGDLKDINFANRRRRNLQRRGWFDGWVSTITNFVVDTAQQARQFAADLAKKAQEATTIRKDYSDNIVINIPSGQSPSDGKVIDTPWPNSVLLKSFGSQEPGQSSTTGAGYINFFCVDCGAKGNAQVSGKAAWTPLGGFVEGEIGVIADFDVILKLGIDAELRFKRDFQNKLFRVNLVGLEFGLVSIGPMVTFDSRVTFEAAANGRLLAGAELGWRRATAKIDFISPSQSDMSGWTPTFKPVFTAEGSIMLSGELGIPVGIFVGIAAAGFNAGVSLVDEPSIKATAQVAGSIGSPDSLSFDSRITDTNGCTGIATRLSWRNVLRAEVGSYKKDLYDTQDNLISQGCIAIGPQRVTVSYGVNGAANGDGSASGSINRRNDANLGGSMQAEKRSLAFPQLVYRRENITAPASNSKKNATVRDLTDLVITANRTSTFLDVDIAPKPYKRTDGYEFTLLVDQSVSFLIISCSNGNVYLQTINATTPDICSDLWASRTEEGEEDVITTDGGERIMHYYANTMRAVRVSRFRVGSVDQLPQEAVPVTLSPYNVAPISEGGCINCQGRNTSPSSKNDNDLYFVTDPFQKVYLTAECTYKDKQTPKMFIIAGENIEAELAMLQSPAVKYSITGGDVETCYVLPLVQGNDDPDQFESEDHSDDDGIDDSLNLDWSDPSKAEVVVTG